MSKNTTSSQFNLTVAIASVAMFMLVCGAVGFFAWAWQVREAQRLAEIAAEERAALEEQPTDLGELGEMLEMMASAKPFEPKPQLSADAFSEASKEQLVEVLLFEALPEETISFGDMEQLPAHVLLEGPAGHPKAGITTYRPETPSYLDTEALLMHAHASYFDGVFTGKPEGPCAHEDEQLVADHWPTYRPDCATYWINHLATLRLKHPLYTAVGKLNPAGVQALSALALSFEPEQRLFQGQRPVHNLYQQLGGAIPDYLAAWNLLQANDPQALLKRYQAHLKAEQARGAHSEDMRPHYEAMASAIDAQLNPIHLGFWLRRMDDGTAPLIHDMLTRAEARYRVSPDAAEQRP